MIASAPGDEAATGRGRFPTGWQAEALDVSRAALDAFARAASGGAAYPIPLNEMVHGAAVTEAIVRSAGSCQAERVI